MSGALWDLGPIGRSTPIALAPIGLYVMATHAEIAKLPRFEGRPDLIEKHKAACVDE